MKPDWSVFVASADITQELARHLTSISVVDQSGTEADRMEIQAADPLGVILWPRHGVEVDIWMGYVTTGLTDLGTYIVDEVNVRNPPRTITIRGNSADLRGGGVKTRRQQAWDQTTVEEIVQDLAAEAGYTATVDPTLSDEGIAHWDRMNESVMAAVTRLARRYDAVATVKRGHLTFVHRGTGLTATGQAMTSFVIRQRDTTQWEVSFTDRDKYDAVEARYRDVDAAEDVWTRSGSNADADSDATFRLRQTYPDEQAAQAAADAKFRALAQAVGSASLTMPGYPQIAAQAPIILEGFDSNIDGRWIVDQVEHRIDNSGFVSRITALPPAP